MIHFILSLEYAESIITIFIQLLVDLLTFSINRSWCWHDQIAGEMNSQDTIIPKGIILKHPDQIHNPESFNDCKVFSFCVDQVILWKEE